MKVLLYKVGRNLNRVYRTCEAFGVSSLELFDCNAELSGNLFKAQGRLEIKNIMEWPNPDGLLALETFYTKTIYQVDWQKVKIIILGGETKGLPKSLISQQSVQIPMVGKISGLTVEAALSIALYEWRKHGHIPTTT